MSKDNWIILSAFTWLCVWTALFVSDTVSQVVYLIVGPLGGIALMSLAVYQIVKHVIEIKRDLSVPVSEA